MGIHTGRTVQRYVNILTNEASRPFRGVSFLWPVSWCGSGDYEKCVPPMGSTRVQDVAEGQGVRRQEESRNRRERERDTGESAEKGVSRTGFDRKAVERCSDTGNFGEKSVARMGSDRKEGK